MTTAELTGDQLAAACEYCHGSGRVPLPRGMSYGFYLFMNPGGACGGMMLCPRCQPSADRCRVALACVEGS